MENASYNRDGKLITDALFNKVRRVFTSTFVLIFVFIITNIIFQLFTYAAAKILGYHVSVDYNNILVTRDYHFWNRKRIIAVFFSSPLACVFISWLLYRVQDRDRQWINIGRLFAFWTMVCFVNIFLSNLAISPLGMNNYSSPFYNNFATIASWLGLGITVMYLLAVISILVSLGFGIFIGKEILRFSFSKGLITTQWGKTGVIFQFFIFPVALSFIPLTVLGTGVNTARIGLMVANLIVMSLGMLIRAATDTNIVRCNKSDVLNHTPIVEFVLAAAFWATIFFFFRY